MKMLKMHTDAQECTRMRLGKNDTTREKTTTLPAGSWEVVKAVAMVEAREVVKAGLARAEVARAEVATVGVAMAGVAGWRWGGDGGETQGERSTIKRTTRSWNLSWNSWGAAKWAF